MRQLPYELLLLSGIGHYSESKIKINLSLLLLMGLKIPRDFQINSPFLLRNAV